MKTSEGSGAVSFVAVPDQSFTSTSVSKSSPAPSSCSQRSPYNRAKGTLCLLLVASGRETENQRSTGDYGSIRVGETRSASLTSRHAKAPSPSADLTTTTTGRRRCGLLVHMSKVPSRTPRRKSLVPGVHSRPGSAPILQVSQAHERAAGTSSGSVAPGGSSHLTRQTDGITSVAKRHDRACPCGALLAFLLALGKEQGETVLVLVVATPNTFSCTHARSTTSREHRRVQVIVRLDTYF